MNLYSLHYSLFLALSELRSEDTHMKMELEVITQKIKKRRKLINGIA